MCESMMWYHGNVSREMCQDILKAEFDDSPDQDGTHGVFLVRESANPKYKFVLSCYFNGRIVHLPIKQYANDAFFSINEKIVHGLDELIKFYQQNDDDSLGVYLSTFSFAKGTHPPLEFCRLGRNSQLHQAVINNDIENVRARLMASSPFVDMKDDSGKTALHLACIDGDQEISKLLISNGASLLIRDSSGKIPFFYACEHGRMEIVELMIAKFRDVIQWRDSETHDVPLHVAAKFGKIVIVKVLLSNNAAVMPRNKDGKFPIDLAADGNHAGIVVLLSRFKPIVKTDNRQWYHGKLSRSEAQRRLIEKREQLRRELMDDTAVPGLFLVRFSEKVNAQIITMLQKDEIMNYEIKRTPSSSSRNGYFYHLEQGAFMESIDHLITHYMLFSDGLASKLTIPLEPQRAILQSITSIENSLHCDASKPSANRSFHETFYFTKSDMFDDHLDDIYVELEEEIYNEIDFGDDGESEYIFLKKSTPVAVRESFDDLFINENNLEVSKKVLGEGCFGTVYKGFLVVPGRICNVAIKTLLFNGVENVHDDFCAFLREAGTMMHFDNPFIVRMIGIVKGPPMRIVQELQALGSLLTYLEENGDEIGAHDINIWATQIAEGMEYLEMKRFVHRDLAARNILLASKTHARISDFGLSRTISVENNTFKTVKREKLPFKWYAPECYRGTFSHAGDVWSFAVTLWEAYTKGLEPYADWDAQTVAEFVMKGGRLTKPEICPEKIFKKMTECWNGTAELRPNFLKLSKFFKAHAPIYENKNLLVPSSLP